MMNLLITKEVARILNVSERVVRQYIQEEGLVAIRLKKRLRIDEKDLNNWLEKRKTGSKEWLNLQEKIRLKTRTKTRQSQKKKAE